MAFEPEDPTNPGWTGISSGGGGKRSAGDDRSVDSEESGLDQRSQQDINDDRARRWGSGPDYGQYDHDS